MERPQIELVIREPTGLELGTFDIYSIRQRIYEGELHSRCEYKGEDDRWRPLGDYPPFKEVLWLTGKDGDVDRGRRRTRFAGWKTGGGDKAGGVSPGPIRIEQSRGSSGRHGKPAGMLGRMFGKKE